MRLLVKVNSSTFLIKLWNILRLKNELIRNQRLPHEGLKNLQDQKFRDDLKYAMAHSPFYRKFYKGTKCRFYLIIFPLQ